MALVPVASPWEEGFCNWAKIGGTQGNQIWGATLVSCAAKQGHPGVAEQPDSGSSERTHSQSEGGTLLKQTSAAQEEYKSACQVPTF